MDESAIKDVKMIRKEKLSCAITTWIAPGYRAKIEKLRFEAGVNTPEEARDALYKRIDELYEIFFPTAS
jgi:hypothetical protein